MAAMLLSPVGVPMGDKCLFQQNGCRIKVYFRSFGTALIVTNSLSHVLHLIFSVIRNMNDGQVIQPSSNAE